MSAPTTTPPRVFISYRTDDTLAVADRLAEQLQRVLDIEVFLDHRSLESGDDWPKRLRSEVEQSAVVLVLVGSRWLTLQTVDGIRRLDDPDDWVRKEIEHALVTGRPIIPVLVDGAAPVQKRALRTVSGIAAFADKEAHQLANKRWTADFESLVTRLTRLGFRRKSADYARAPGAEVNPEAVHRKARAVFEKKKLLGKTVEIGASDAAVEALAGQDLSPLTFMAQSRAARIRDYLIPLMHERIAVEVEVHKACGCRLSDEIIKTVRAEIVALIDEEWTTVLTACHLDSLRHVVSYGDYKRLEIEKEYERWTREPPPSIQGGRLFDILDASLSEAQAELELGDDPRATA